MKNDIEAKCIYVICNFLTVLELGNFKHARLTIRTTIVECLPPDDL
jgi:hypothetical protein